jgi:cytoskeletal protein CcmA (bactofilin family)
MSNSTPAFVIPPGLELTENAGGLALIYDGDIELHGTLGLDLNRICSNKGNVALHVDLDRATVEAPAGEISLYAGGSLNEAAAGSLTANGNLTAAAVAVTGNVSVTGNADVDTVACGGDVRVGGSLRTTSLSAQSLEVQGDARFGDLKVEGATTIVGSAQGAQVSSASVQIDGAATVVTIHSDGDLVIEGDVEATSIQGARVRLIGGVVNVRTVQASESIEIGPGAIKADALVAPSVTLSRDTRGKITVIESRNDVGASAVKGCLRLSDLEDLFGNSAQFMADRGIAPLGEINAAPAPLAAPAAPAAPAATAAPADHVVQAETTAVDEVESEPAVEEAVGEAVESAVDIQAEDSESAAEMPSADDSSDYRSWGAAAVEVAVIDEPAPESDGGWSTPAEESGPPPDAWSLQSVPANEPDSLDEISQSALDIIESQGASDDAEDAGDPVTTEPAPTSPSNGVEDIFDLEDRAPTARDVEAEQAAQPEPEPDPVYIQMTETVGRIVACYDADTMPPAITQLQGMVEARNYTGIRDDITNIWNQLLKFHQKRGLRIQPQVTTTFNSINSIVRKL